MQHTRYWGLIKDVATPIGLDPLLVEAIVSVESSGNTDAFRFEPAFWNRYLKPKPEWANTNARRVSSSYGLMQVMYPVALERGFPKDSDPELLFVPAIGLYWGCVHLKWLLDWAGRLLVDPQLQTFAAVCSYNGGKGGNDPTKNMPLRNGVYGKKVEARYQALQEATD